MLGKCIKNEFINRWRHVAGILGGLLGFSVLVFILDELAKNVIYNNYFHMIVKIIIVVYFCSFFAASFGLIFLPFNDYRRRFFKDQGYLTHTLPVKTSTLILGKIICDLILLILMVIVFAFSLIIASGDFSIFSSFIDMIKDLLEIFGTATSRALLAAVVIMGAAGFFLGIIFSIWQLNLAYAFGHMFNNGKRIMSIVGYFIIWSIYGTVQGILVWIIQRPGIYNRLDQLIQNLNNGITAPSETLSAYLILFSITDIFAVIGVALLAVGTALICKNRLNLE